MQVSSVGMFGPAEHRSLRLSSRALVGCLEILQKKACLGGVHGRFKERLTAMQFPATVLLVCTASIDSDYRYTAPPKVAFVRTLGRRFVGVDLYNE